MENIIFYYWISFIYTLSNYFVALCYVIILGIGIGMTIMRKKLSYVVYALFVILLIAFLIGYFQVSNVN